MTLTIEVTGELEAALKVRVLQQGLSADRIATRLLAEALAVSTMPEIGSASSLDELPLLHLGEMGPLNRRDIYDDAR